MFAEEKCVHTLNQLSQGNWSVCSNLSLSLVHNNFFC